MLHLTRLSFGIYGDFDTHSGTKHLGKSDDSNGA